MQTPAEDYPEEKRSFSAAGRWLFVLLAAVLVLIETESPPALAGLLPGIKVGLPAVRSAFWLRKADPCRDRRRACFWFYVATGCWQAAATSVVMLFLFMYVETRWGVRIEMARIISTCQCMAVAFGLTTLLGLIATFQSWRWKVRIFVIPNIRMWTAQDFVDATWPQGRRFLYSGQTIWSRFRSRWTSTNWAFPVLVTSVFLPMLVVACIVLAIAGRGNRNDLNVPLLTLGMGLLFVGPFGSIPIFARLSDRLLARTPAECWHTPWPGCGAAA